MRIASSLLRHGLALSALSTLILSGCGASLSGSVTNADSVTIAMVTYPGDAAYFVAEKGGIFRKNGVNAHVRIISDFSQATSALQSGDIEFFYGTADYAPIVAAAGIDVKEIMINDLGDGGDGLLVKSDVNSIADLKGKTVYLAQGNPSHFLLRSVAEQAGLQKGDLHMVRMDADQVGASFAAGKIDYGMSWEPWLTKASAERKDGKVLFTSHDYPGLIADTLFVRSDYLRDHPEQTKAVVRALFEAADALKTDPNNSYPHAAEGLGITVEEFTEQISTIRYLSLAENLKLFDRATSKNIYDITEQAARIYTEDGIMEHSIDADSIVDHSVLRSLR